MHADAAVERASFCPIESSRTEWISILIFFFSIRIMNKLSYGIANLISRKEKIYRAGYQFRFVSLFVLTCFNFTVISIYIYIRFTWLVAMLRSFYKNTATLKSSFKKGKNLSFGL